MSRQIDETSGTHNDEIALHTIEKKQQSANALLTHVQYIGSISVT